MDRAPSGVVTCRSGRVFFRELLERRFPEWARAEGSRGHFEWDIRKDELLHLHPLQVIAYEGVSVLGRGIALQALDVRC